MSKVGAQTWREWRSNRSPDGREYYNYPTALAKGYLYHVLSIGQARLVPGYRFKPGSRGGFLLHYTARGVIWQSRRGQRWTAPTGSASLLDFSEETEHGNKGPNEAHLWWALLDGRDLPHMYTELRADQRAGFDRLDTPRFEALFLDLLTLTKNRPEAYEVRASAAITGLLAELFAARARQQPLVELVGATSVLSEPVRKGIDYIVRFYMDTDLNLKRISEAASLSPRHFARLFRAEVNVTPIQYLARYRVEQAKRLLTSSDKTVEQIARMVGASSQTYFAYSFRQLSGQTPRQFRQASRAGANGGAARP